jgi:hypothetical protein
MMLSNVIRLEKKLDFSKFAIFPRDFYPPKKGQKKYNFPLKMPLKAGKIHFVQGFRGKVN